jgi:hypothetical protein
MRKVAFFVVCLALIFLAAETGQGQVVLFRPEDRAIIEEFFRVNTGNLPPGLAKRGGNLPPGLRKHLRRNGRLPPGLQKRVSTFPQDLELRLPPLPPGLSRGTIGNRAIIYDPVSKMIYDIIEIFRRTG